MRSFFKTGLKRKTRGVVLAAGLVFLTAAAGISAGIHLTMVNIKRHDLLKESKLDKAYFPWGLSLGWTLIWAPTPPHRTPEYLRKLKEADSLLAFDAGVIGPLSGIKKYDWQAEKDIPRAQEALRKAFVAKLGRKLDYVGTPTLQIHSAQKLKDGMQRIIFSAPAEPGYQIKGCMIIPPGQDKVPAVMLAYGAGGNISNTCGWEIDTYHNDMGLKLAQKGFITVVYILRGMHRDAWDWGKPEWEPLDYDNIVGYSLLRGSCAMNIWVNDGLQVLRAIEQYPRVDANKIMFGGISHGGQIAMYAGAIEPERIKGVLAMGSFASLEDLYTKMHHWTGHAIPDMGRVGDMGDIAALIAPRPLMIQWGEYDGVKNMGKKAIFQPSSLTEFERVKQVYERLDAGKNIHKVITPRIGHNFDIQAAVRFLSQYNSRPK
jgi:pimeloyl-ACP methyl ester carboxylesterase